MTACPKSATATLTGFAGLLGLAASIVLVPDLAWPTYLKALMVLAATAAAMIAVDMAYFRTFQSLSTGLQTSSLRPPDLERVLRKLLGLIVTLAILAALYWILPEYRRDFYDPYWAALHVLVPVLLAAAPFYIAYVDRRQIGPEDSYAEIGAFILKGVLPQNTEPMRQHVLGWIVKGFFLPLMFVYSCSTLDAVLSALQTPSPLDLLRWHAFATDLLFMVDVLVAVVGYVFTLRILDTHIRSVEPTVLGWLVCLACYAPLNNVSHAYLDYETGGTWVTALADWPALAAIWGMAILLCLAIFVWSTVSFGLRFSNLTHRGIITTGPYRWMKHPAYVAKNLSWWLVSMPFLTAASPAEALRHSAILLGLNGVYLLRAVTEERHLSRDPDYVAYRRYITEHGAGAQIKRIFAQAQALPEGRRHRRSTSAWIFPGASIAERERTPDKSQTTEGFARTAPIPDRFTGEPAANDLKPDGKPVIRQACRLRDRRMNCEIDRIGH